MEGEPGVYSRRQGRSMLAHVFPLPRVRLLNMLAGMKSRIHTVSAGEYEETHHRESQVQRIRSRNKSACSWASLFASVPCGDLMDGWFSHAGGPYLPAAFLTHKMLGTSFLGGGMGRPAWRREFSIGLRRNRYSRTTFADRALLAVDRCTVTGLMTTAWPARHTLAFLNCGRFPSGAAVWHLLVVLVELVN